MINKYNILYYDLLQIGCDMRIRYVQARNSEDDVVWGRFVSPPILCNGVFGGLSRINTVNCAGVVDDIKLVGFIFAKAANGHTCIEEFDCVPLHACITV